MTRRRKKEQKKRGKKEAGIWESNANREYLCSKHSLFTLSPTDPH